MRLRWQRLCCPPGLRGGKPGTPADPALAAGSVPGGQAVHTAWHCLRVGPRFAVAGATANGTRAWRPCRSPCEISSWPRSSGVREREQLIAEHMAKMPQITEDLWQLQREHWEKAEVDKERRAQLQAEAQEHLD